MIAKTITINSTIKPSPRRIGSCHKNSEQGKAALN